MLKKGAYSRKYQQLELERMRCVREGEKGVKRSSKDRAHILSKQTAQRQRALEQKKHAMALAEEERRRKALEERRRAQQEATERFKSAIGRLRSASSKSQSSSKSGEMNVEIYVPKNPALMRPSAQKGSVKVWERSATNGGERIAIGREVEVTGQNGSNNRHGLERRTPSLDDVLRSIREGKEETPRTGNFETATSSETAVPVCRRNSDTSLVVPIYQAKTLLPPTDAPPKESSESQACGTDSVEKQCPDKKDTINDNMVFQPVLNRLSHREQDSGDDIQILSPDSATSPTDSLCESGSSTELQDSLERTHFLGSSRRVQIELQQKQQKAHRRTMSKRRRQNSAPDTVTDSAPLDMSTLPSSHSQLQRCAARANTSAVHDDSDSSSSTDSLRYYSQPRPTPPRSRRHIRDSGLRGTPPAHRKLNLGGQEWNREAFEIKESKIVGILKKPDSRGSQQDSKTSTACPSHVSSVAGSMLIADVGLGGGGGSEIASQSTVNEGGIRALKRVRFVDQVEPSTSRDSPLPANATIPLDSARIELWKKVLPNGFSAHFLPNSAFTPRMKISLSSKALGSATGSKPPNGLVVHVPRATVESSSPGAKSPEVGVKPNSEKTTKSASSPAAPHSHVGNHLISENLSQSGKGSSVNRREDTTLLDGQAGELNGCSDTGEGSREKSTDKPQKPISLERTPTDDDINELWDQIRRCLHTNEKVTVPPQVFNFKPPPEDVNPAQGEGQRVFVTLPARQQPQLARRAGSGSQQKHAQAGSYAQSGSPAHGQKQLVHRQPNRPLRCHNELHQAELRRRQTNPHTNEQAHANHRLHEGVKDPELSVSTTGSGAGRRALTTLSIEEQRLLHSIEILNKKLRERGQQPPAEYHLPHSSSTSKKYFPPTSRVWGAGDLPKTRVRRHPKTVALAAAMKAEALDSRTQVRSLTHRQPFYNT